MHSHYIPTSLTFEGLTNVEFHCGKAEDVFPNILSGLVSPRVTAIVDPPRAGLRKKAPQQKLKSAYFNICHVTRCLTNTDSKVILAIRRAEHLKRLVYVACNAKAAMNNFIE